MAFKVGDRVRIKDDPLVLPREFRGRETTITGPSFWHFDSGTCWPVACWAEGAAERVLEPLTPPAEDAWAAEQVRKVTKLHPLPVPVGDEQPTLREVMDHYRAMQQPLGPELARVLYANLWDLYEN